MELYPKSVTKQCHKNILDQMNNSIYDIKNKKEKGLFCYIKINHNKIPVLIINKYINNDEYLNNINVSINKKDINIEIDDIIYKDKINNISIIKIKNDNKNIKYIEIDDKLYEKESEIYYKNESIYILQNIKNDILVSYGIIKEINKNEIIYTGNINSNYSLIYNLNNNKLIGIHKKNKYYYNKGLNFRSIIKETKNYLSNMNEINILINIEKVYINKEIYFLNDSYNDIIKLNKNNTELYINDKKEKYKTYIKAKKIGINKIVFKINCNLKKIENIFKGCEKIISINFINFNTQNITSMKNMFYECENLKEINFLNFDIKNVKDMSFIFYGCNSLNKLRGISEFDTKNVKNMGSMFLGCNSLKNLPDISKWDTKNVENMSFMFSGCSSLNNLPDISTWDTKNVKNMSNMFYDCNSLKNLPDISKWITKNVKDMNDMFDVSRIYGKRKDKLNTGFYIE